MLRAVAAAQQPSKAWGVVRRGGGGAPGRPPKQEIHGAGSAGAGVWCCMAAMSWLTISRERRLLL